MMNRILVIGLVSAFVFVTSNEHGLNAQQPEWTGRVLKVGIDRQYTDSLDILERPYRPFHFYGNTVRRMHYRGFPLPLLRDFVMSANAIVTQRDLWFADSPSLGLIADVNSNDSVFSDSDFSGSEAIEPQASGDQDAADSVAPNSDTAVVDVIVPDIPDDTAHEKARTSNDSFLKPSKFNATTKFASSIVKLAPKPALPQSLSNEFNDSMRSQTKNVAKIIASSIKDIQSSDLLNSPRKVSPLDSIKTESTPPNYR